MCATPRLRLFFRSFVAWLCALFMAPRRMVYTHLTLFKLILFIFVRALFSNGYCHMSGRFSIDFIGREGPLQCRFLVIKIAGELWDRAVLNGK